ncbi:hypothetical protein [Nesterenkonia sp. DZ6]|uniref:hypothetical protein n=1 Tax=Nesterenkonia sp. DZ6 TaxID=2901229 RepID=UPI001F4D2F9A|nr:hypothetical protein [Nesterenkonia sp. DZ6]MCH8560735.1 hypothetical protein [Nesterenkonia sp. DZ6]
MFSSPALLRAARGLALANFVALGLLFASAGLYVQDFRGLDVHGVAAVGLHITSGALALALVLRAWGTKTGLIPAVTAVLLFVLTFLQALVGSAMTLTLHFSGALVLAAMATWLIAWAFSRERSGDARRSPELRNHYPEGAHS